MTNLKSIAVFGLGRIGLPIALSFANRGIKVYGFDSDIKWIETLNEGRVALNEVGFKDIYEKVLNRSFFPLYMEDKNLEILKGSEVEHLIICFGISRSNQIGILYEFVDRMNPYLNNKNILIRTTLPVGFTRKIKNYIEERYGMKEGKDFSIVFVPERLVEGKGIEEEEKLPKIIGYFSERGKRKTEELFSIFDSKIYFTSPETAEFIKLIDNSYRNLLFNFSNELAILASELGIDIMEAIKLAKDGYDRNKQLAFPGPVSGYCLSKDPLFLDELIKEKVGRGSLSYLARKINQEFIQKSLKKVLEIKKDARKIVILGLSFKKDVDDFRDSHVFDILDFIYSIRTDFQVFLHDPFLDNNRYTSRKFFEKYNVSFLENIRELRKINPDVVILSTPHSYYLNNLEDLDLETLILDLYYSLYEFRSKFKRAKIVFL